MSQYLFPHRLTRRDFLSATAAAVAGLAAPSLSWAKEKKAPVRIGSGYYTYELVEDWGKLPPGKTYGFGCGIIVDSKDRIYVTTRSADTCVAIFNRHGKLLETWSDDFAKKVGYQNTTQVKDTAHCLYWSKEHGQEYIYWTENNTKAKEGPRDGKRVYKTDLRGKILYEIGNVAKETSTSQKFEWESPTDVAVAPNGDIYVVDGYGSQRVTRFDKNFKELRTIGGRGKQDGKFNICHGIWVTTFKGHEPEIYIADRANARVQVFDLELNHKRTLTGNYRNPCCFYQYKDNLYIPDLGSRVTIIDKNDKLVAHLGDGKSKLDNRTNPALFAAPHAMCVDSKGDIYVVEWVDFGRPRKFKHTPA